MIVPDINLLLYAHDAGAPSHSAAVAWWEACLSGATPIGLAPVVLFGFLRIATNPRIYTQPMTPAEGAEVIRSWLARRITRVLEPAPDHVGRVLELLERVGTAANLVTDAQIAALALEQGAVIHTTDADFARFSGVTWFNPLTGSGSGRRGRR